MTCLHCRGQMRRDQAPLQIDRRNYHLQFDRIPAWVCQQCGEAYFEAKEVDWIQDAVRAIDERVPSAVSA